MRAAAELLRVTARRTAERERGGLIGHVQRAVEATPGAKTKEIREQLDRAGVLLGGDVSGCLNKLLHEGHIRSEKDSYTWYLRWYPIGEEEALIAKRGRGDEVFCRCGTSILFGPLATAEERATPRCSAFPFARRGAA